MKKITEITGTAIPITTENIDTDQIIPARFLKVTDKKGIGNYFFYNWRFTGNGKPAKSIFSDSRYKRAKIIIAGKNFGCGSSREHAVWVIMDYGVSGIISESFGDIFYQNSLKNGLLPIRLKSTEISKIMSEVTQNLETKLKINLINQTVTFSNKSFHFDIDLFWKQCLLNGVDELGMMLSKDKEIKKFESAHPLFISTP